MPNLILGVINNYRFEAIANFLLSLKRTGYAGHTCLFVGPNTSRFVVQQLQRFHVEVIKFLEDKPFLPGIQSVELRKIKSRVHVFNYRHFLYLDYLTRNQGRYDNVLLTDIRDVIFQRDPFDFDVDGKIHVAVENTAIPIADEEWT